MIAGRAKPALHRLDADPPSSIYGEMCFCSTSDQQLYTDSRPCLSNAADKTCSASAIWTAPWTMENSYSFASNIHGRQALVPSILDPTSCSEHLARLAELGSQSPWSCCLTRQQVSGGFADAGAAAGREQQVPPAILRHGLLQRTILDRVHALLGHALVPVPTVPMSQQ